MDTKPGTQGELQDERPWEDEPDELDWTDEATRMDCRIVRGPGGYWCGYAAVPFKHVWHGRDYTDIDYERIGVHWGLTFAGFPLGTPKDNRWWFGFDCGHCTDVAPSMRHYGFTSRDVVYRDIDFVMGECAKLAQSLRHAHWMFPDHR